MGFQTHFAGSHPASPRVEWNRRVGVGDDHAECGVMKNWSGWRDSNPRPLHPQCSALPDCATARSVGRAGKKTGKARIGKHGKSWECKTAFGSANRKGDEVFFDRWRCREFVSLFFSGGLAGLRFFQNLQAVCGLLLRRPEGMILSLRATSAFKPTTPTPPV